MLHHRQRWIPRYRLFAGGWRRSSKGGVYLSLVGVSSGGVVLLRWIPDGVPLAMSEIPWAIGWTQKGVRSDLGEQLRGNMHSPGCCQTWA